MITEFACPKCGAELEADASVAGSGMDCPQCQAKLTVPKVEIGPGVTIGDFRIEGVLGAGGMGRVFLARQLSMDREVALKILPPQFAVDAEGLQRFLNEVKVLASLNHPNIVQAHAAGEDGGTYFLAMAYVKGMTLEAFVRSQGPVAETEALFLVRRIASALEYAWEQRQVVHRDIKPENIILDATGTPHVTDLGLSKSMAAQDNVTLVGTVIGTPNYMSPEQMQHLGAADVRSDQYSLGATLYFVLTGQVPFEGNSLVGTFQNVATQSLPDPRGFVPGISAGCVGLLQIMLAKDPASRYQSWGELLRDINHVKAREPLEHPPVPAQESVLQVSASTPTSRTVVVRQAAGGTPTGRRPQVSHEQLERMRQQHAAPAGAAAAAPRRSPVVPVLVTVVLLGVVGAVAWSMSSSRKLRLAEQQAATEAAREDAERQRIQAMEQKLAEATTFAESQSAEYAESIRLLEAARTAAGGTEVAARANGVIERLKAERRVKAVRALAELRQKAGELRSGGRPEDALALLRDYAGEYAGETADERQKLAAEIKAEVDRRQATDAQKHAQEVAAAKEKLKATTAVLAGDLLKGDLAAAAQHLAAAEADASLAPAGDDWNTVRDHAKGVLSVAEEVVASFSADAGKTIPVVLKSGARNLTVIGVTSGSVVVRLSGDNAPRRVDYVDLSVQERAKRAGKGDEPEREILRGILACEAKSYDVAKGCFTRAACALAQAMSQGVDGVAAAAQRGETDRQRNTADTAADKAFGQVLDAAGLAASERKDESIVEQLGKKKLGTLTAKRVQDQAKAFKSAHGNTQFAKDHERAIAALLDPGKPADDARSPGKTKKLDVALERLKTDNPTMAIPPSVTVDGTRTVDRLGNRGYVTVRLGSGISNLTALAGVRIHSLFIGGKEIETIEPLRGMPLVYLQMVGCSFSDLSPLKGMQLTYLGLLDCKNVTDLSPLKDMPLTSINISGCIGVKDTSVLGQIKTLTKSTTP